MNILNFRSPREAQEPQPQPSHDPRWRQSLDYHNAGSDLLRAAITLVACGHGLIRAHDADGPDVSEAINRALTAADDIKLAIAEIHAPKDDQ